MLTSIGPSPISKPAATNEAQQSVASTVGLSIGAKTGTGVGVTVAGLCMACGAFFLGVFVHRRSRKTPRYMENWNSGEKPQLDGKAVYGPMVVMELNPTRSMQELDATGGMIPELAAAEPRSHLATESGPVQPEIATDARYSILDSDPISPQQSTAAGTFNLLNSPVSPLSDYEDNPTLSIAPEISGPVQRDTYDDPRLVQNPWAQEDAAVHKK